MKGPVSHSITQKSASNLALAFILLPPERREAMSSLYAFCRRVDDIADDETVPAAERGRELAAWRTDIQAACEGQPPRFAVNRELVPHIRRYQLSFTHFDELIRGVEMDLEIKRYQDWEGLELYCYRVASVVGLLSIEIFGYQDPLCRDYAVHLGRALQFTNILRDVRTDAEGGRIYLPQQALERFGVTEESILAFRYSEKYRALAQEMARRAREFYRKARQTLPTQDRRSMVSAELMGAVYWRLFCRLESRGFDVFTCPRVRVSKPGKLYLILRTWMKWVLGLRTPNYGS